MSRQVPVRIATPSLVCMISSEKEIPLVEANRIAGLFLQNLKDAYGEDVFPEESPLTFHFEVSVDGMGQITSPLPTLDQLRWQKGIGRTRSKCSYGLTFDPIIPVNGVFILSSQLKAP
jgi:hypothetical protein